MTAIFVAAKALEAWFLADTAAMSIWLETAEFFEAQPELTPLKPWDRLKDVAQLHGARGPGNKTAFAKRMVNHYGFDIRNAAAHPGCASAKELVDAVQSMLAGATR
ncbi:DUF4276 family protein [Pseudomonas sp. KNUC1026]|uniref:DUF4276 family protein n=1 Tax=Pseudomonas sp. KNUC1026 TaxID=2893890 RepID=UPI001F1CAE79|nr:DUF4276 family protein [Pseudomonas sp. KNUC1026]UFH50039.1 DUF4276 family protein [Pseudomonas sp. KNUC1026]